MLNITIKDVIITAETNVLCYNTIMSQERPRKDTIMRVANDLCDDLILLKKIYLLGVEKRRIGRFFKTAFSIKRFAEVETFLKSAGDFGSIILKARVKAR